MLSKSSHSAFSLVERGKRYLKRRGLDSALECFRSAVDACPVKDRQCLGNALYWLGLALLRVSKRDIAARSFASAQKLLRRGYARKTYLRLTNEYGMPRQKKAEDDDRIAFYSIQIALYLKRRSQTGFTGRIERDLVLSTLADAWKGLSGCPGYRFASGSQKLTSFKAIRISYPVALPQPGIFAESISVDFRKKRKILPSDYCPCGSGISYGRCCGRIVGIAEASNGYF
jgi:tetratricopeptide (TPR) repeat protein